MNFLFFSKFILFWWLLCHVRMNAGFVCFNIIFSFSVFKIGIWILINFPISAIFLLFYVVNWWNLTFSSLENFLFFSGFKVNRKRHIFKVLELDVHITHITMHTAFQRLSNGSPTALQRLNFWFIPVRRKWIRTMFMWFLFDFYVSIPYVYL